MGEGNPLSCKSRLNTAFELIERLFLVLVFLIITLSLVIVIVPASSEHPHFFLAIFVIFCIVFIVAYLILISKINELSEKTRKMIILYPEFQERKNHHAIIIAHKDEKDENGDYQSKDYLDGVDLLINRFRENNPPVPYKIYEIDDKEMAKLPILLENTPYLWIFGHGRKDLLRLGSEDLCYAEIKNSPKKLFVGQYTCGTPFGKSLADITNADDSDVSWHYRLSPLIRISVRKKLDEMEIGKKN